MVIHLGQLSIFVLLLLSCTFTSESAELLPGEEAVVCLPAGCGKLLHKATELEERGLVKKEES